jgi:hypothetical protein
LAASYTGTSTDVDVVVDPGGRVAFPDGTIDAPLAGGVVDAAAVVVGLAEGCLLPPVQAASTTARMAATTVNLAAGIMQ